MIYYVEDEKNIRELVEYALLANGFEIRCFADGVSFWQGLREEKNPELILLDIMLPGENGMEILHRLKENAATKDIPVIMVTAKGSEYDKVLGLDSGADDYIAKPFGMMELVSRIKAVLRRTQKEEVDTDLSYQDIRICNASHKVFVGDEEVELTKKEYNLLSYLIRNQGVVLTRDQLLNSIWGYDFDGETRTVDVHVRSLRQKLGNAGDCVTTVRGIGYRIGE
ncbi:MAG: response regulator transcription factor [Lachnospiraceae bacterium]|nr:response regulator transcription factor [Lachnospiraceae bacterium]